MHDAAMIRRGLLLLLLLLVAGCGNGSERVFVPSERVEHELEMAKVMAGVDRVEVYRIDGDRDDREPLQQNENRPRIGRYHVISRGPDRGAEFAARLAAVLSDPATFPGVNPGCVAAPGVAYRVWRGSESTDILICFKCSVLSWGPRSNPETHFAAFLESKRTPDLVRLAKEALPNDPEISSLSEK